MMNEILEFSIVVNRSINLFENDELYQDFETGFYDEKLQPVMFEKAAIVTIQRYSTDKTIVYDIKIIGKKNFELKEIIIEKMLGTKN